MRASTEITLEGVGRFRLGKPDPMEEIVDGSVPREVSLSAHYTNDPEGNLYDDGDCDCITVGLHARCDPTEKCDEAFSVGVDFYFKRDEAELLRDWLEFALEQWA